MTEAEQDQEPGLGEASYPATLFACQNSSKNAHPYQSVFPSKPCQTFPDVLDSNPLLDTGSVTLSEGFGLCDDEVVVPLCGVETKLPKRTKHSSRQCVC